MKIETILEDILKISNLNLDEIELLNENFISKTYKIKNKNKVIKITTDLNKFLYAYKYSRLVEENSFSVKFYDLFMVNDSFGVIIMEYYNQKNLDKMFRYANEAIENQDFAENILDVEVDLMDESVNNEFKQFIDEIYLSSLNWSKLDIDIHELDINKDTVGINDKEKYILFNQKNKLINENYIREQIDMLDIKKYNID